jgi:HEAT repeat protein
MQLKRLLYSLRLLPLAAFICCPGRAVTEADCTHILEQALADRNPDTRKEAVEALSLVGARGALADRLQDSLRDKDVAVRVAAVASLAELKSQGARDALHKTLSDDVPEVSFAAAKALWSLHDPAGEQALRAVLAGENKTSSGYFTKEKRDALRMLHMPRSMFLFALRQGVGLAPIPGLGEGIASMQGLLTDPGVSGRAAAALLLAKDTDPATVDALKDALEDKDWSVRAAAAHALALRDNPQLKKDLEPLLSDKKEAVRLRAAAGFLRLSAIPARSKKR